MPAVGPANLSLSITNPLVLYRTLVATRKIKPDPAQHRLALHLQTLYFRLKDYAPEIDYRYRLEKIGRKVPLRSRSSAATAVARANDDDGIAGETSRSSMEDHDERSTDMNSSPKPRTFWQSLWSSHAASTLALTRTTPLHDSALHIDSPRGMLLYGEVGRGKSMLLDLLFTSLPSRKKCRWHFNVFMLDIFRRLEAARIDALEASGPLPRRTTIFGGWSGPVVSVHEHVVLTLAKDTISESPILFLDEFQMPDRTASKLINSFFTAFFHLGGVLVASSNRMPEELSKAAGIEFGGAAHSRRQNGGFLGLGGVWNRASMGQQAAKTDFALFLDVLRARCEVWEIEGERDWRRENDDLPRSEEEAHIQGEEAELNHLGTINASSSKALVEGDTPSADTPPYFHLWVHPVASTQLPAAMQAEIDSLNPDQTWEPTTLTVYARSVHLATTHDGILKSTFSDLCANYLGPADYVSVCSHFHTLILTGVPTLTLTRKNEARRFITLLDALYEAGCRLLIEAAAPPDKLFFQDTRVAYRAESPGDRDLVAAHDSDAIVSEAFSEMHQDSTAPFRPNVSLYTDDDRRHEITTTPHPSFTQSLRDPSRRNVLADEDADFGLSHDTHRDDATAANRVHQGDGLDFTSTAALTGEDERFAYKRARSRLWEMCGRKWWMKRSRQVSAKIAPGGDEGSWWLPVDREGRFWEGSGQGTAAPPRTAESHEPAPRLGLDESPAGALFRYGASPFRRAQMTPPKFGWHQAWGTTRWGRKAGKWGIGVETYTDTRGREQKPGSYTEEERPKASKGDR